MKEIELSARDAAYVQGLLDRVQKESEVVPQNLDPADPAVQRVLREYRAVERELFAFSLRKYPESREYFTTGWWGDPVKLLCFESEKEFLEFTKQRLAENAGIVYGSPKAMISAEPKNGHE